MADALASGASVLRDVGVQVPLRPQYKAESWELRRISSSRLLSCFFFPRDLWGLVLGLVFADYGVLNLSDRIEYA